MLVAELTTAFGLSIESNDVNIYYIEDDNGEAVPVQFGGVVIILPFIKIHIGSFDLVE
jgi:hypothetical protein